MWKLGNIEINGRVVLGPMAGFTSEGYRNFMVPFGCALSFTEMVSDMGLIYENEETNSYVKYVNNSSPTGVQLFGNNPSTIAKSALQVLKINPSIEFFDVNMGCPVNKVIKAGSGSALMKDPKLAGEIIKELKKVTSLPVTAKIRLGYDEINFLDVIKSLEEAGVDAISIHARTRNEFYYGLPHFDLLKDLQLKMKVPLIISGNIFTVKDAINALEITKATAVMVARGSLGNPELISNINLALENKNYDESLVFEKQKKYCIDLAKKMIEEKGEILGMRVYRSIAPKFFSGFKNSKDLRSKLASQMTSFTSMIDIIEIFEKDNIDNI